MSEKDKDYRLERLIYDPRSADVDDVEFLLRIIEEQQEEINRLIDDANWYRWNRGE